MKETDLNKNIPIENVDIKKEELSVEGSYLIDCIEQLDENETDVDKISKATHQFLLTFAIKIRNRNFKRMHWRWKGSIGRRANEKKEKNFDWSLLQWKFENAKRKIIGIIFYFIVVDYDDDCFWKNVFGRKKPTSQKCFSNFF